MESRGIQKPLLQESYFSWDLFLWNQEVLAYSCEAKKPWWSWGDPIQEPWLQEWGSTWDTTRRKESFAEELVHGSPSGMNDESTAGFSSEDSVVETSMTSTIPYIHPTKQLCCFIGICFPVLQRRPTPELILKMRILVSKQGWKTVFAHRWWCVRVIFHVLHLQWILHWSCLSSHPLRSFW